MKRKRLTAADCLWPRVKRVLEEERSAHIAEGMVFAVFTGLPEKKFCGLASVTCPLPAIPI